MNHTMLDALATVRCWAADDRLRARLLGLALGEPGAGRQAAGVGRPTRDARLEVHDGIALIPVDGVLSPRPTLWGELLGGTALERVRSQVQAALEDRSVRTLALVIDSPGGDVAGVPELAEVLRQARAVKPVLAHARYLAASGAYWLASQAALVSMEPSAEVGSIGVYTLHASLVEAYRQAGIDVTTIEAGAHKTELAPWRVLSESARAYVQSQVDETHDQFVREVARGRGVPAGTVRTKFGQGRLLLAGPAKAAGLVDRVSTLEDLLGWAAGPGASTLQARTSQAAAGQARARVQADRDYLLL